MNRPYKQFDLSKHIYKVYVILYFFLLPIATYAQKDMFDESIDQAEQINNSLIDIIGTFIASPENHGNALSAFSGCQQINNICQAILKNKYETLSQYNNDKVHLFYNKIEKINAIAEAFEELTRTIVGYNSSGIEGTVMEILVDPLLIGSKWNKRILNITCEHAYFVEYSYNDFKMLFIKNTLPPNDDKNFIYYNIEVTFAYDGKYNGGGTCYVGGNKYRMIQFKDNENSSYYNIAKATSVRK